MAYAPTPPAHTSTPIRISPVHDLFAGQAPTFLGQLLLLDGTWGFLRRLADVFAAPLFWGFDDCPGHYSEAKDQDQN